MAERAVGERVRRWRPPGIDGLEVLEATLVEHEYGRHAHETVAIGVIDEGEGAFWCHGATHVAGRDCLVLIGAGEAHTGHASSRPVRYRMLYPEDGLVESLLGGPRPLDVACAAPHDRAMARAVRRAFETLARPDSRLEGEDALLRLLELLLGRYLRRADPAEGASEPRAVQQVRAYLEAHVAENVSLQDLAALVELHPAYLSRVFREAVGLPPHAYLTNLRVTRAKALLAEGAPASAVAARVGFTDQSHLTRHFRRAYGVTPGRYGAPAARPAGRRA